MTSSLKVYQHFLALFGKQQHPDVPLRAQTGLDCGWFCKCTPFGKHKKRSYVLISRTLGHNWRPQGHSLGRTLVDSQVSWCYEDLVFTVFWTVTWLPRKRCNLKEWTLQGWGGSGRIPGFSEFQGLSSSPREAWNWYRVSSWALAWLPFHLGPCATHKEGSSDCAVTSMVEAVPFKESCK